MCFQITIAEWVSNRCSCFEGKKAKRTTVDSQWVWKLLEQLSFHSISFIYYCLFYLLINFFSAAVQDDVSLYEAYWGISCPMKIVLSLSVRWESFWTPNIWGWLLKAKQAQSLLYPILHSLFIPFSLAETISDYSTDILYHTFISTWMESLRCTHSIDRLLSLYVG